MGPAEFVEQFVVPALVDWEERPDLPHRAACAILQLDILADMVAAETNGGSASVDQVRAYRTDLDTRAPELALIRNAADSHKHGKLGRPSAKTISQGQRPYRSMGTGFFAGHSHAGDPVGSTSTAILSNDGKPLDVGPLLVEAVAAWGREFTRIGLPAWPE